MLLLWMVSINLRGSFSYEMSWFLQVLSRFWQLGPWSFRWNVWRPPPSTYLKVASNLIIWKIFNISCHFDSRAFVASLPREKVSCAPDEEQQCPICLKAVEEGDRYQFYRKHSSSYSYHTISSSVWWLCPAATPSMMLVSPLGWARLQIVHCAGFLLNIGK